MNRVAFIQFTICARCSCSMCAGLDSGVSVRRRRRRGRFAQVAGIPWPDYCVRAPSIDHTAQHSTASSSSSSSVSESLPLSYHELTLNHTTTYLMLFCTRSLHRALHRALAARGCIVCVIVRLRGGRCASFSISHVKRRLFGVVGVRCAVVAACGDDIHIRILHATTFHSIRANITTHTDQKPIYFPLLLLLSQSPPPPPPHHSLFFRSPSAACGFYARSSIQRASLEQPDKCQSSACLSCPLRYPCTTANKSSRYMLCTYTNSSTWLCQCAKQ